MKPLVSIVCITYNHAPYIRQAIENMVNQETDFDFEIIVHDDCSTDGTTDVVREFAEKYPDIIKPIIREKNIYSQGKNILQPLYELAQGEYIASCEGDDYWCDNTKLQKQVDYMRNNPECSLVIHNGYLIDEETAEKSLINPYNKDKILSGEEVIVKMKAIPPTASMLFKRSYITTMPEFFLNAGVGDQTKRMYLMLKGHVYYMNDAMCVYRFNVPGSFTERVKKNEDQRKRSFDKMIKFFQNYDEYTNQKYHKAIELVISREYFGYYLRRNEKIKAYKTEYFKQTYSLKERIVKWVAIAVPSSLKRKLKSIKNSLSKD